MLIEGDNYHALSVLNYTHKGKIDVIYIDPPYNTGAKDWRYNNDYVDKNDGYRHSKWLSMMANRLKLAKRLLKPDGVLICAIDENERPRIEMVLEELFYNCSLTSVSIIHNPQGIQGDNFSYTHEYAIFVIPKIKNRINQVDVEPRDENLRDDTGNNYLRTNARNCFYPILVKGQEILGFGNVPEDKFHPQDRIVKKKGYCEIWPLRDGVERKWRYARQSVEAIKESLFIRETIRGNDVFQTKTKGKAKTVWVNKAYHAGGKYGTKLLNDILGRGKFEYPKSLHLILDILRIATKRNSVVLDFFAGSGTTGHAVSLLNKEDGGDRRFILCTNNENGIAQDVCLPRIKAVINGYKYTGEEKESLLDKKIKVRQLQHMHLIADDIAKLKEQHSGDYDRFETKIEDNSIRLYGIKKYNGKKEGLGGNLKYFKTTFVPAQKTDKNKVKLMDKATDMLCVKENTFEEVKNIQAYKVFRNGSHYTGIIYNQRAIDKFKKFIDGIDGKFVIYVFSLGDEDFREQFVDMDKVIKLSPIPKVIMQVYRRIFK